KFGASFVPAMVSAPPWSLTMPILVCFSPPSRHDLRRFEHGVEQHVSAGGGPLLGNLLGFVMAEAADTGAHHHGARCNLVGPAGVVTSARNQVHLAIAELFGGCADATHQCWIKGDGVKMADRLHGVANAEFGTYGLRLGFDLAAHAGQLAQLRRADVDGEH